MGILSSASGVSVWRGYEYYKNGKRVQNVEKLSDSEYTCRVKGSQNNVYDVKINIDHIRQSKCNCPHADGKRIICKHMVALFFTVFPKEAKYYLEELEEIKLEEERRAEEEYEEIRKYVYGLSKQKLRELVIEYMLEEDDYW